MSKASESALGALHAAVAKVLTDQLAGEGESAPSASTIQAAIAFLKNNNITADPEVNSGLVDLKNRLAEKRKESKGSLLNSPSIAEAQERLERDLGGLMQ